MTSTPPEADVLLDANGPLLANRIRIVIAPWNHRSGRPADVALNAFRQGSKRGQRHKADQF
jgi:hypothetical protein